MKATGIINHLLVVYLVTTSALTISVNEPEYGRVPAGRTANTTSCPVEGHPASNVPGVFEYLGIPYAKPPLGELRFQPPQPNAGSATINGSTFGKSCLQPSSTGPSQEAIEELGIPESATAVFQVLGTPSEQSEDCLTLNVWGKPRVDEPKKPVLVWIHGGAFSIGSSSVPAYNGKFFADQEDIVVVSFNYRLNVFGFPGNPNTPPNLGLLDVRLALEWVRDNIARFGGDEGRITIFGQSAGGALVDTYSYGWASDPIARGFVPMSGVVGGFTTPTAEVGEKTWIEIAANVGCDGDEEEALQCMMVAPAHDILQGLPADSGGIVSADGLPFGPVADGVRVFDDYAGRRSARGGYLVGNTDNESGLFRAYDPSLPDVVWEVVDRTSFTCPAALRAARASDEGRPTWRYRWFGDFPNMALTTTPPSGAWHTSDIPIIFDTAPQTFIPDTAAQVDIGKYLRGAWAAFARDPEGGLLEYGDGWPGYNSLLPTLIQIGYKDQTQAVLALGGKYVTMHSLCLPP